MEQITSRDNPLVKQAVRLMKSRRERRESGLFVAEGIKLCCEAAGSGRPVEQLLCTRRALERYPRELEGLIERASASFLIGEGVEQKIADTAAPQGVYCLCQLPPEQPLSLDPRGRYLLLVSLQDPGNVGTILRSCEAFGVTALLVTEDCPDLYSPKVLRSTMGSVFRLPVGRYADPILLAQTLGERGITLYGAALGPGSRPLSQLRLGEGCCIAVGNEGNGLPADFLDRCAGSVIIEMKGRAESLNAAAAASILAYALTKD